MASLTQWTWSWVNAGSWWWTGRPGVLQSMGLKRVGHDWVTELNWTNGFSSSHVWMWKLDHNEGWALKNWCFWNLMLEKTLENILDSKEIKPVNPKGNQSWIYTGRTDAEGETPTLWPPDVKSWLIGKDPDAGKDWRQEKGAVEDKMVRYHHWLNGHEFEQTPGDSEGQGRLVCCSPWRCKGLDMTELLNNKGCYSEQKAKLGYLVSRGFWSLSAHFCQRAQNGTCFSLKRGHNREGQNREGHWGKPGEELRPLAPWMLPPAGFLTRSRWHPWMRNCDPNFTDQEALTGSGLEMIVRQLVTEPISVGMRMGTASALLQASLFAWRI